MISRLLSSAPLRLRGRRNIALADLQSIDRDESSQTLPCTILFDMWTLKAPPDSQ